MSQLKELPQVSFAEAAQNVFKKMFQFKGRIRRSEYWWGVLVFTICAIVLSHSFHWSDCRTIPLHCCNIYAVPSPT